jgi:hypothetical protein
MTSDAALVSQLKELRKYVDTFKKIISTYIQLEGSSRLLILSNVAKLLTCLRNSFS